MLFKNRIICEEFEKEMWRYLDGTLNNEESVFWEKHLSSCPVCTSALSEMQKSLSIYETLPLEDIEDKKFDLMVEKAVKKSRFFSKLSGVLNTGSLFKYSSGRRLSFSVSRAALSTIAFAAIVMIMFIIYRPKSDIRTNLNDDNELKKTEHTSGFSEENNRPEIRQESNSPEEDNSTALNGLPGVKYTAIKTNSQTVEWKAEKLSSGIHEVDYSLDRIDAGQLRHSRHIDKWTLKAAAIDNEIERLEKELSDSSL